MSLEALYDERMQAAAMRDFLKPPQPVAKSFDAWAFATAASPTMIPGTMLPQSLLGGAGSGLSEIGASVSEFLSGAQSDSIRAGRPRALMDSPDDAARRSADMKLLLQGGPAMRQAADSFVPPEAAHEADKVLHGLGRIGAKAAVASALPGGPLVAGAAVGVEETNTRYRELVDKKGVDPNTALKVAGVMGAAGGLGLVAPMAGPGIVSTIALASASGPGLYMAQEKIAQKILESAGYRDEASLHDPTDPLGLTVASLFSLGVGGHRVGQLAKPTLASVVQHLESKGKRYGNDGELLTSPKGAQGEMQVMPKTATDPGFGVTPARDSSPDELARVGRDYIAAMEKRYEGDSAKALAAYNAGPGAVDAAVKKAGDGWLAQMPAETRGYVAHGLNKLQKDTVAHASQDPAVVEAARVRVTEDALNRSLPDHLEAREEVMAAHDHIAAGRMPVVDPVPVHPTLLPEFKEWFGESKVVDENGAPKVVYHGTDADVSAFDNNKLGFATGAKSAESGHFFTNDPETAASYAHHAATDAKVQQALAAADKLEKKAQKSGKASDWDANDAAIQRYEALAAEVEAERLRGQNVVPAYLSLKNPAEFDAKGMPFSDITDQINALIRKAKKAGNDGVIVRNLDDAAGLNDKVADHYVVFDPKQIKSAIGNSGKFDRNSASLTDPLQPGERNPRAPVRGIEPTPPRAPEQRLPDANRLAADEVAAPTETSPINERLARLAEAYPSGVVALRKRVSILNSILECIA